MSTKKKRDAEQEKADLLSDIMLELLKDLKARVAGGTADAATLNVARQLLKDNNVQVSLKGEDKQEADKLGKLVPFPKTGT